MLFQTHEEHPREHGSSWTDRLWRTRPRHARSQYQKKTHVTIVSIPIGAFLTVLGISLFLYSEAKKYGVEKSEKLVTTGIHSKIRHPMYIGMVLQHYGYPFAFKSFMACFLQLCGQDLSLLGSVLKRRIWREVLAGSISTTKSKPGSNYFSSSSISSEGAINIFFNSGFMWQPCHITSNRCGKRSTPDGSK